MPKTFCAPRRCDEGEALVFWGEDKVKRRLTWPSSTTASLALRRALPASGVQPGDRVAGFVPNMPETVIAALATASHRGHLVLLLARFRDAGVIDRFGQIEPALLFTADGDCSNGTPRFAGARDGVPARADDGRARDRVPLSRGRPARDADRGPDAPRALTDQSARDDPLRASALRSSALHHVFFRHYRRAEMHRPRRRRHPAAASEGTPPAWRHPARTGCSISRPAAG